MHDRLPLSSNLNGLDVMSIALKPIFYSLLVSYFTNDAILDGKIVQESISMHWQCHRCYLHLVLVMTTTFMYSTNSQYIWHTQSEKALIFLDHTIRPLKISAINTLTHSANNSKQTSRYICCPITVSQQQPCKQLTKEYIHNLGHYYHSAILT